MTNDLELYNAAASNAVISGINSKDAICLALTGRTRNADKHAEAVPELKGAGAAGRAHRDRADRHAFLTVGGARLAAMETGVSVVGSGQVSGAPDVLRVSFSVEHVAADVAAAVAQVGQRTDAVVAALRDHGVAADAIGTTTVSVFQEYREPGTSAAYRGSHMLTVTTKNLTSFGRLLNAAVDAGGNSLGLHALEFDIEDKTELLTRARALAFQQAKTKAAELAGLAGYSLGSVRSIAETHGFVPIREGVSLGAGKAFDSAVNIIPGGQDVQVTLEVQFAWA